MILSGKYLMLLDPSGRFLPESLRTNSWVAPLDQVRRYVVYNYRCNRSYVVMLPLPACTPNSCRCSPGSSTSKSITRSIRGSVMSIMFRGVTAS